MKKNISTILILSLFLPLTLRSFFPAAVSAGTPPTGSVAEKPAGVTLTGTFRDNLMLTADNDYFFHIDIMDPGDQWTSTLHIKNDGKRNIQVRLQNIVNHLEDSLLLKALRLQIRTLDGALLYSGPYAGTPSPVFDWILLQPGEECILLIQTEFPCNSGNNYQSEQFDVGWVFKARTDDTENQQGITHPDGVLTDDPSPVFYYLSQLSTAVLLFVLFLVHYYRKERMV